MMRTHEVDGTIVTLVQSISEWNWKREKNLWAIKFQSIILCILFSFGYITPLSKTELLILSVETGINSSVTDGHSSCILPTCNRNEAAKKTASNKSTSSLRGYSDWTERMSSEHLKCIPNYIILFSPCAQLAHPLKKKTIINSFRTWLTPR